VKLKTRKIKAQSIIEYIGLVLIVSAAMSAMVFYIQRALDVRVRHLNQELNESQR
jgi:isoprenylcysteine carboxyl methyltransferase (ICMT) family protein YpbQ